ncbi:hypothetical protein ZIOFF_069184 [Zingiber officinale]|uniref:MHD domain-containing protein n=1 Tax=Zingiber officinale TaxID=94328 RepID=A0A8J5C5M0_ZINOF|nr:hypothetical protein ZIOFF_069184 [Zingiber officinale]
MSPEPSIRQTPRPPSRSGGIPPPVLPSERLLVHPGRCVYLDLQRPLWFDDLDLPLKSRIQMTRHWLTDFIEATQGEVVSVAAAPPAPYSTATNVEIELPVPSDATNANIRTSMGSASYAPENNALVWQVKSFPGGKEYMCRAEFSLPSITAEEATAEKKAPIRVKFEIPYFTVSGIQVRYLKIIEKSGYQALPWVRYITMAGEYELRLI